MAMVLIKMQKPPYRFNPVIPANDKFVFIDKPILIAIENVENFAQLFLFQTINLAAVVPKQGPTKEIELFLIQKAVPWKKNQK